MSKAGVPLRTSLAVLLAALIQARSAFATFRYGPIQVSGNFQTQNLIRTPELDQLHLVQQRNTFRLQYEHKVIEGNNFLGMMDIPFITQADFFAYYRFVYDSIYHISPGGRLQASDESTGGTFDLFRHGARDELSVENVLREVFLDFKVTGTPVSFRIGRQQLNWGEADSFRALDSVNPINLTWHLQQEAGLLGKVGFDELRIPMWAAKMLVRLGTIGPFSNMFIEAYDNPFDFQQSKVAFLPRPWSVAVRDPFRPGLVIDAGATADLPDPLDDLLGPVTMGRLLLEPCFDSSGRTENNATVGADFSQSTKTGFCDGRNFPLSSFHHGLFDKHDPFDVNQFGTRLSATALGAQFTLNYIFRRHYFDIPTAGSAKVRQGAVADPMTAPNFISLDQVDRPDGGPSHVAMDPITGQDTTVLGFIRIPVEFYMPQVHVLGFSANYFEEFTGSVFRTEATYTHGFPISDIADPNGVKKKDVMLSMIGFDRPTWIRFLNPRATFLLTGQLFVNWIPGHEDSLVGVPNATTIPRQFRDEATFDRVKEVEMLSTLILTTFYKGGSVVPVVAVIPQWSYMPTFAFIAGMDYYLTNNLILTPALRIYTTPDGGVVDEPYGIGRLGKWDEVQLKLTYQY